VFAVQEELRDKLIGRERFERLDSRAGDILLTRENAFDGPEPSAWAARGMNARVFMCGAAWCFMLTFSWPCRFFGGCRELEARAVKPDLKRRQRLREKRGLVAGESSPREHELALFDSSESDAEKYVDINVDEHLFLAHDEVIQRAELSVNRPSTQI